jgi:RnfABCDGE-type electron transport complex G subunit
MSDTENSGRRRRKLLTGILVLACICLASGTGIGVLYNSMKDQIDERQRKVFDRALAQLFGDYRPGMGDEELPNYETLGEYPDDTVLQERVFVAETGSGVLYAAMGQAQGYQSLVKVLVAVAAPAPNMPVPDDPQIHGLVVVESQETPGLGEQMKAVEKDVSLWGALAGEQSAAGRPWFQEQFSGKKLSDLEVVKREDTDKIAALTGATITSRAATRAALEAVQKIIEKTREAYGG